MIVFGWGHRKGKVVGPVHKQRCARCQQEDFWELHEFKDYASLFFVPLIPYKTLYAMVCPVCQLALELTDPDEVERVRAKARANMERLR